MKIKQNLLTALALTLSLTGAMAQGSTAFTYQGRLNDGANAANGLYDLDFTLFAVPDGGSQLGSSATYSGLPVSNGLFTVKLDFGAAPFIGADRWLQIQVRTNGGRTPPPWTVLSPRQPLTPAPYALYAPSAGTASNVAPLSVTAGSIANGTITAGKLASGQVVKSLNGLFDAVTLSAGTNVTLTPSGNDLKISATPGTVVTNAGWGIAGNSGTTAANFLGTMDGQPLELRVNGQRALRLEPAVNGAPNIVSGSASNRVAAGVVGATVAGGGNSLGGAHRIEADYGSIGGGYLNTIQTGANLSFIAGGYGNTIRTSAFDSSIGGGAANTIQSNAYLSTIGGGSDNLIQANAKYAIIAGGEQNTIQTDAYRSTIGGGSNQRIESNATNSFIGGGYGNTIRANAGDSTIGGGSGNLILSQAQFCTISGGYGNAIQTNTPSSSIGGGYGNTIWAYNSTIGGGAFNTVQADAYQSTIGGGIQNLIEPNTPCSTISGGTWNAIQISATNSTIGGGTWNAIRPNAQQSTIGGGYGNTIWPNAQQSTIAGGSYNTIQTSANGATISGGDENAIASDAWFSTIGGGAGNAVQLTSKYSTIGGGGDNDIRDFASTIGGGVGNTIEDGAQYSFIGGGLGNDIQTNASFSTIGGGSWNDIQTNASFSIIGGGARNSTGGECATVPGGQDNSAVGSFSLAAGYRAKALHAGTFVWADAMQADHASTGSNQFCVRASGGVQLSPGTSLYCGSQTRQMLNLWSTNYGVGVQNGTLYFRASDDTAGNGFAWFLGGRHNDGYINSGGGATLMTLNNAGLTVNGTFVSSSDRNLKENFTAVSPREVLDKVTALPISRWNFKGDAATAHVGPMAQDFHAAFGLGTDDKHIATVDADGVALAAIQGLNQKLEVKSQESEARSQNAEVSIRRLAAENAELKQTVNELKELLKTMNDQLNGTRTRTSVSPHY